MAHWWRIRQQCRRCEFDPWVWKVCSGRKWQHIPVFLPRESHGQRSLAGYSSWGRTESDMTEHLSTYPGIQILNFFFFWSFFPVFLNIRFLCCFLPFPSFVYTRRREFKEMHNQVVRGKMDKDTSWVWECWKPMGWAGGCVERAVGGGSKKELWGHGAEDREKWDWETRARNDEDQTRPILFDNSELISAWR